MSWSFTENSAIQEKTKISEILNLNLWKKELNFNDEFAVEIKENNETNKPTIIHKMNGSPSSGVRLFGIQNYGTANLKNEFNFIKDNTNYMLTKVVLKLQTNKCYEFFVWGGMQIGMAEEKFQLSKCENAIKEKG